MSVAGRGYQVFMHTQGLETTPAFRYQPDAEPGRFEAWQMLYIHVVKSEFPCGRHNSANTLDGGGFTHTIPSHQCHDFTFVDGQVDIEQCLARPLVGTEVFQQQASQA